MLDASSLAAAALPPAAPFDLPENVQAFRATFAAEYASTGNGPDAVRAAVARHGGSRLAKERPSEVSRRLLKQPSIRHRIAELRGEPTVIDARRRQRTRIDLSQPPPPPTVAARVACAPAASDLLAPEAASLPPEVAARLAAVAFDPTMPSEVSTAAATHLRRALAALPGGGA